MPQGRLFPLEIVRLEPSGYGSADLRVIGIGEDRLPYAVKRPCDGIHIPASELLCTRLAAACGLPAPVGEIARLPDGTLAFASRWEGGTLREADARFVIGRPRAVPADILSAIFAFDLFVSNPDRHAGNYLLRTDSHAPAFPRVLAFDFSRAFLAAGWPLPDLPPTCNTRIVGAAVRALHGFDGASALATLEKLYRLPGDAMGRLCQDVPPDWIAPKLRRALDRWWRRGRVSRLEYAADLIDHET
jgi:hypothetical protein